MEFRHIPVLLDECIEFLNCRPNGLYVDGTLGGGGHAEEILKRIGPDGILIGIDRDPAALEAAGQRLQIFGRRFIGVHNNFNDIKQILKDLDIKEVDGILLDLGVSSFQLDNKARGFSYQEDAPLDMRMDTRQSFSAYHVVNEYSESRLSRIIREYGEENWADRIAQFIVREREKQPIETTGQLVETIKNAIPARARRRGPHPAKRTFQAIRIEVNAELAPLEQGIRDIVDVLKTGGRLCIITFHSLEDRIVKRVFRQMEKPCICSPKAPICTCGRKAKSKIITPKPIPASEDEIRMNPRARSAKLRVLEKLEPF
ncbi:MAG: 16S rRNA (cytosine(1402)-N(4))-methyltransferase RsmH [Clostridia bacterium]